MTDNINSTNYNSLERFSFTNAVMGKIQVWHQKPQAHWFKREVLSRIAVVALTALAVLDMVWNAACAIGKTVALAVKYSIGQIPQPENNKLGDQIPVSFSSVGKHALRIGAYALEAVAFPLIVPMNPKWGLAMHVKLGLLDDSRHEAMKIIRSQNKKPENAINELSNDTISQEIFPSTLADPEPMPEIPPASIAEPNPMPKMEKAEFNPQPISKPQALQEEKTEKPKPLENPLKPSSSKTPIIPPLKLSSLQTSKTIASPKPLAEQPEETNASINLDLYELPPLETSKGKNGGGDALSQAFLSDPKAMVNGQIQKLQERYDKAKELFLEYQLGEEKLQASKKKYTEMKARLDALMPASSTSVPGGPPPPPPPTPKAKGIPPPPPPLAKPQPQKSKEQQELELEVQVLISNTHEALKIQENALNELQEILLPSKKGGLKGADVETIFKKFANLAEAKIDSLKQQTSLISSQKSIGKVPSEKKGPAIPPKLLKYDKAIGDVKTIQKRIDNYSKAYDRELINKTKFFVQVSSLDSQIIQNHGLSLFNLSPDDPLLKSREEKKKQLENSIAAINSSQNDLKKAETELAAPIKLLRDFLKIPKDQSIETADLLKAASEKIERISSGQEPWDEPKSSSAKKLHLSMPSSRSH